MLSDRYQSLILCYFVALYGPPGQNSAAYLSGRSNFSTMVLLSYATGTRVRPHFASEAKFEIEAKILFRLEVKKSLISHDSLRCETLKI
jgi:hypothetical protein